jgi:hypothetical protein
MCDISVGLSCSDNGCDCEKSNLYWNGKVCAVKASFCEADYELTCGSCLKVKSLSLFPNIPFTHPSAGPPAATDEARNMCHLNDNPNNQLMVIRNQAQFLYLKSKTNTNSILSIWV